MREMTSLTTLRSSRCERLLRPEPGDRFDCTTLQFLLWCNMGHHYADRCKSLKSL